LVSNRPISESVSIGYFVRAAQKNRCAFDRRSELPSRAITSQAIDKPAAPKPAGRKL
jgi:hypothetical protein